MKWITNLLATGGTVVLAVAILAAIIVTLFLFTALALSELKKNRQ